MSKKKAAGKTRQHTRPEGKRLGVKVSNGEPVNPGNILMRQHGAVFGPGKGVELGRDYSLYSMQKGFVKFGKKMGKRIISVI